MIKKRRMKASSAHTHEGNSQTLPYSQSVDADMAVKKPRQHQVCVAVTVMSQVRVSDLLLEGSLPVICGFKRD